MPTYHLTFKQVDWNFLWATPAEMEIAWRAIDDGDVVSLRSAISSNPKIARWEESDFFRRFGASKNPTPELLDCIIEAMGPIERHEYGHSKFFRPATLHGKLSPRAAELLLSRGANVNANVGFGWTPLDNAVLQARADLVEIYLAAGASTKHQNPEQKTPLRAAIDAGHKEIEKLLINANATESGIPCVAWKSKPESSVLLRLKEQESAIKKLFDAAVETWIQEGNETVGTIAVNASGVKGYVRVGISRIPIEPYSPDCCSDVAPIVSLEIDSWREAHRQYQQVVAEVGRKESKATGRSLFSKRDKPFYTFVKDLFVSALKTGVFDDLQTDDQTVYACQSYYFHHCDCWNARRKRIAIPKEWSATGRRKPHGNAKAAGRSIASTTDGEVALRTYKTSAHDAIYCELLGGWAIRNSTSLWSLAAEAKKPASRIALQHPGMPMSLNDDASHLLTGSGERIACVDLNAWEIVDHLPMNPDYGELFTTETTEKSCGDWLHHCEFSSVPLQRIILDQRFKLQKRAIELPQELREQRVSTIRYHVPTGLLAVKMHLDKVIQIGLIEKDQLTVLRSIDLESHLSVIFDFFWSPAHQRIVVEGEGHDDARMLLIVETASESVTAMTSLGNAERLNEVRFAPSGSHFAVQVVSPSDQVEKNEWPQRETVVIFDAATLQYHSHLPVEDIACYAWSGDGSHILVGGYSETTLWSCSTPKTYPKATLES